MEILKSLYSFANHSSPKKKEFEDIGEEKKREGDYTKGGA